MISIIFPLLNPLVLFSYEHLLVFLHFLIFYFFLRYDLDGQLTCLLNDLLVGQNLSFTCSSSLHDLIQNNSTCVYVLCLQQLSAYLKLASDDLMHLQFQNLSYHELHLGCLDSFLYGWVRGNVKMLLIYVLFSRIQGIFVRVVILITVVKGFLKIQSLLFKGLQFLCSHHSVDLSDITQGCCHKRSEHFGI